jgi:hypothetical protein
MRLEARVADVLPLAPSDLADGCVADATKDAARRARKLGKWCVTKRSAAHVDQRKGHRIELLLRGCELCGVLLFVTHGVACRDLTLLSGDSFAA